MFPVTSRYHSIAIAQIVAADGRTIVYLRRRFLPAAASAVTLVEHAVVEGDRLDNVTARYLGDPEQFWRVCDANNAMQPEELVSVMGRRLNIPLPQGS
jgi:hypothetical protein